MCIHTFIIIISYVYYCNRFLKRKNEYGDRQEETMNKLLQFTSSLRQQKQKSTPIIVDKSDHTVRSQLHSASSQIDSISNEKSSFCTTIDKISTSTNTNTSKAHMNTHTEAYHGQILETNDTYDHIDDSWHVGRLKFRKHIDDAYRAGERAGSDGRYQDDYVVEDTRISGNISNRHNRNR